MIARTVGWPGSLLVMASVFAAGCGDDGPNLTDAQETLSASIVNDDTTMLRGEAASITAEAVYRIGPGAPLGVVWTQSDSSVLTLTGLAGGMLQVTAKGVGTSLVEARINETFLDTIAFTVVDTGAVRWRRALAGSGVGWDLAVTDSGEVVTIDGGGQLLVYRRNGDTLLATPGACATLTGPVFALNAYWTSGASCTARFDVGGALSFSVPVGGPDERMAAGPNGDGIVLARLAPDDVLALSRYGPAGALVWRDTIRTGASAAAPPRGGVAVAANGDVYVAWRVVQGAPPDSGFLARYTAAGVRRWEITLPGPPRETAPAVVGTRIYVAHGTGVAVRDTAGGVIYDRPFTDVFALATGERSPTQPVVDLQQNVYVQIENGLFSLDPVGAVRWAADSLPRANAYAQGPVLLQGSRLVTVCGLSACGVDAATGAVRWHGPPFASGGLFWGGLAPAPDGTLFVKVDNEVIALWHRQLMAVGGWPTPGGTRGRAGRAQ